jgi:pyrroline-5-carboxylate reductase
MKIGFLGGGNMAAAMIGGLQAASARDDIVVVERDPPRRTFLERNLKVTALADLDQAIAASDLVVIAVKPTDAREVCEQLGRVGGAPLVLSIAAGIPSAAICTWCRRQAVVRAMPNTPALIGLGMTGAFARAIVSHEQRAQAQAVLRAIGDVIWFDDEGMLDAVTAISGSGPAYVFYFMEALQKAAQKMGMDAAQSRAFVQQTFVGAARLAVKSQDELSVLRERVTSKGGTTFAALESMRAAKVEDAIIEAAQAALARSRELGQQFGK